MTFFERVYRLVRRCDHPLYQRVHRVLADFERQQRRRLELLDVGGRRSNYTIGLTSDVTISDIPRETDVQHALDLGATEEMREQLRRKRSNVKTYVLDDMTETQLPAAAFDAVVAVEVLEHVDEDEAFVKNVARVLKPGGLFVMTTPNGDFLPVPYADHRRHYRRVQLAELLGRYLSDVHVQYAVNAGALMEWGVYKLNWRSPFRSLASPPALFLSNLLEVSGAGGSGPTGKRHLVATARQR